MNRECPFCREEVDDNATICKHCHTNLQPTRKDKALSAIGKLASWPSNLQKPEVSGCKAMCYALHSTDKARLRDCLNDCAAASALATVADKLQTELFESFLDYIWSGGDIDPVPFEKSIRQRFARGYNKQPIPDN